MIVEFASLLSRMRVARAAEHPRLTERRHRVLCPYERSRKETAEHPREEIVAA